jgi:hypothetical protein
MAELLLEALFEIIFGIFRVLFLLPGELVTGRTDPGGAVRIGRSWFKGWLALFISLSFWFVAGLLIYFLARYVF